MTRASFLTCINKPIQFRNAEPQDVEHVVALICSAGPQAVEYGFGCSGATSGDFLRFAFADGKGFLGYQNHTVATIDGQVVGIAAFYNFSTYVRLTLEHLGQLWRFYPAQNFVGLVIRGARLKSIMPPPRQYMHYVANFGVSERFRGMGVGSSLLDHHRAKALALGRTRYALDVSVDNPRAQALYERYGFATQAENQFTGPSGAVPNTRRMTMSLVSSGPTKTFTAHQRSEPV
jgi:ribosomal protein S18 acetylase RimI-like enzyme